MNVDIFDFELPDDRIALRPASPREAARMLVVDGGQQTDNHIQDLPKFLRAGDVLVLNDTKVIPAQLEGLRKSKDKTGPGAKIKTNLHKRISENTWRAFIRPAKKVGVGDKVEFGEGLHANVTRALGSGEIELQFANVGSDFFEVLDRVGKPPLPPYIASKRTPDAQDLTDYQTLFARYEGSVAAPTAGLHITRDMLTTIKQMGVEVAFLTLHVGAGTFLPVKVDNSEDHVMHSEWGSVSAETAELLNRIKKNHGRIICVGTTSLRLLESATDESGNIQPYEGDTDIFITPGYQFRAADLLLTNFHLPRSTLFMLVSAFAGLDVMKSAYAHAVELKYRFYSYGDACLLHPNLPS